MPVKSSQVWSVLRPRLTACRISVDGLTRLCFINTYDRAQLTLFPFNSVYQNVKIAEVTNKTHDKARQVASFPLFESCCILDRIHSNTESIDTKTVVENLVPCSTLICLLPTSIPINVYWCFFLKTKGLPESPCPWFRVYFYSLHLIYLTSMAVEELVIAHLHDWYWTRNLSPQTSESSIL